MNINAKRILAILAGGLAAVPVSAGEKLMNIEDIKHQCKLLHLPTVAAVIAEQESIPESNELSFIDRIGFTALLC